MRRKNKCEYVSDDPYESVGSENGVTTDHENSENESIIDVNNGIKVRKSVKTAKNIRSHRCHCGKAYTKNCNLLRHMRASGCDASRPSEDELIDRLFTAESELENANTTIAELRDINSYLLSELSKRSNMSNCQSIERAEHAERMDNNGTINNSVDNHVDNSVHTTNNNTINNSNTFVVSFGSEDIEKLGYERILKCMQQGFFSAAFLTEELHFNPELPQYHNIYTSDMSRNIAVVYKDNKWQMMDKNQLIQRLYDDKRYYIEDNYEKYEDNLKPSQVKAIKRYIDNADDSNNYGVKKSKDMIEKMLYNSKDMPLEQRRLQKS